jgi:hypothetical protein
MADIGGIGPGPPIGPGMAPGIGPGMAPGIGPGIGIGPAIGPGRPAKPGEAAAGARALPQLRQNFMPGGFSPRHTPHTAAAGNPEAGS